MTLNPKTFIIQTKKPILNIIHAKIKPSLCLAYEQTTNFYLLEMFFERFVTIPVDPPQKLIAHRMLIDYITQTFMNTEITFGNIKQAKK